MVASINEPLTIGSNILMFSDRDLEDVHSPHDNTFVIKIQISNALVRYVLVDNGSGVNVIFNDVVEKMGIHESINKGNATLHTFNVALIWSLEIVKLAVQA